MRFDQFNVPIQQRQIRLKRSAKSLYVRGNGVVMRLALALSLTLLCGLLRKFVVPQPSSFRNPHPEHETRQVCWDLLEQARSTALQVSTTAIY